MISQYRAEGRRTIFFFFFNDTATTEIYTLSLHDALPISVFHFQGEGSYEIEGPSEKVNNAFNGIFKISKKYIRLLTDEAETIKNFGFDIYKLKKGEIVDISETGFAFITPVDKYELEYDIVKIDGDKLFFGKRPVDNDIGKPEKRPTEFGLPVVKY